MQLGGCEDFHQKTPGSSGCLQVHAYAKEFWLWGGSLDQYLLSVLNPRLKGLCILLGQEAVPPLALSGRGLVPTEQLFQAQPALAPSQAIPESHSHEFLSGPVEPPTHLSRRIWLLGRELGLSCHCRTVEGWRWAETSKSLLNSHDFFHSHNYPRGREITLSPLPGGRNGEGKGTTYLSRTRLEVRVCSFWNFRRQRTRSLRTRPFLSQSLTSGLGNGAICLRAVQEAVSEKGASLEPSPLGFCTDTPHLSTAAPGAHDALSGPSL